MRFSKVRITSLTMAALLVSTGLMEGAEQAKFHLPVTAHWGQAVLLPGDYRILLPEPSLGQMNFRLVSASETLFELPLVTNEGSNPNASYLKLTAVDGTYFIREFSSAPSGKAFLFSVPKEKHSRELAKAEDTRIPVSTN